MLKNVSITSEILISDEVVYRNLDGEIVLLNLKTNDYCGLDNVGSRIWQLISQHKSLERVRDELIKEFDVEKEKCTEDVLNFIKMLQDKDLIEIKK